MARATLLHTGFYCSIQDLGRLEYRNIGVPQSGAMDMETVGILNRTLDNHIGAAVLEMISVGSTLKFDVPARLAISPNVDKVFLNDFSIDFSQIVYIQNGDILKIGRSMGSNFIYAAVFGGWQTKTVLGSRCMYHGITRNGHLKANDEIAYQSPTDSKNATDFNKNSLSDKQIVIQIPKLTNSYLDGKASPVTKIIEVFRGPEFDHLPAFFRELIFTEELNLSRSWNRMAFRIATNTPIDVQEINTAPTLPGMIQVTPSGELIVLMRDAQTTGGYPRVLQCSEEAIDNLSQAIPGSLLKLRLINF